MKRDQLALTVLARAGFTDLGTVRDQLGEVEELTGLASHDLLDSFSRAADPDGALRALLALLRQSAEPVSTLLRDPSAAQRLLKLLGASAGLAEFFLRQPSELSALARPVAALPSALELATICSIPSAR